MTHLKPIARRGLSTVQIVVIIVVIVAVLALSCVGLLAGIMLPAIGQARESARAMRSQLQLQQIELTREVYLKEVGAMEDPPTTFSIQTLVDQVYITPDILDSPVDDASDGRGDYWFNPILMPDDPENNASRIASYDRAMYEHADVVAACFYDGACQLMDVAEFEQLVEAAPNAGTDFDLPVRNR